MKLTHLLWSIVLFGWIGSSSLRAEEADVVVRNGKVLVCDTGMTIAEAFAVRQGRIVAVGSDQSMQAWIGSKTQVVELGGKAVLPGFCDSHLHFVGLGDSLQSLDLRNVANWDALIDAVAEKAKVTPKGTWIDGRGWHQSKWNPVPSPSVEGYPIHTKLSERVPDHPVLLTHTSGHACLANAAAMKLAQVTAETENPSGGEILHDEHGHPTGIFRENAQRLIYAAYLRDTATKNESASDMRSIEKSVELAGHESLKHGITSVHDAGSSFAMAKAVSNLADQGKLPVRVYMMIREGSGALLAQMEQTATVDRGNGFLTIKSVKVSIDGALGSHGAWLLTPYEDLSSSVGLNTVDLQELDRIAQLCKRKGWQLCVHAIGDRANRESLDVFERTLGADVSKDHRWRIEHAQHIDPADLPRFAQLGVIPVMQAIHCTSDATFVYARLGQRRAAEGAYMWRSLIDSWAIIPNGTDAPVELIDPRLSLYASVTRKLPNGEYFFPEQCMTRREALLSYTLWPAIAAFQERELGSIEVGKRADFVVWDKDLLECPPEELLTANVVTTWIDGKERYRADSKNR